MGVHLLTAITAFLLIICDCQEVTEVSLQCNSFMNITSPGYPEPYKGVSGKTWTVTAPLNGRVFISFNDFETEDMYDHLIITDMVWTSHRRSHSGQRHFPPFLSLSHRVEIEFIPYHRTAGNRGFHLSASCYQDESATIRLIPTQENVTNEGRLELKQDGRWMPVCSDDWDDGKAEIACRELGYPGVFENISTESSHVVNSISIQACERSPHRLQDCDTYEEQSKTGIINLKCQNPGYIGNIDISDLNVNKHQTISVRSARECIIQCRESLYNKTIIEGLHCYCANESSSSLNTVVNDGNCRSPCIWNTDEPCDNIRTESVPVFSTLVGFCPQPEDPTNGACGWNGPYYYGSTLEVNCDPQFKLKGDSSQLRCAANEGRNKFSPEWTGLLSCIRHTDQQESTSPPVVPTDSDSISISASSIPTIASGREIDPRTTMKYATASTVVLIAFCVVIFFITRKYVTSRWKRTNLHRGTHTHGEGDASHTGSTSYSETEHHSDRIGHRGERIVPLTNRNTDYLPASSDVYCPVENEYICLDKPTPQCTNWDPLYPTPSSHSVISRRADSNHSLTLPIAQFRSDEVQPLTLAHTQTLNRETTNHRPLPHRPTSNSDQHFQSSNDTRSVDRGIPNQTPESRLYPEVFYHTLENPESSSAGQTTSTRFSSSEETQDEMVANPLYFSHSEYQVNSTM